MGLCEQQCTVYLQRVICTCFDGYKFSPENQKQGKTPVCVGGFPLINLLFAFVTIISSDVDECLDNNGDCEHECINELGSYRCECRDGFKLRGDNRTCELIAPSLGEGMLAAHRDRCYANCETVNRLHEKLKTVQEKVACKAVLNKQIE